jgi:hypothetical protein
MIVRGNTKVQRIGIYIYSSGVKDNPLFTCHPWIPFRSSIKEEDIRVLLCSPFLQNLVDSFEVSNMI